MACSDGKNIDIFNAEIPAIRMSVAICGGVLRSRNRTTGVDVMSETYGAGYGLSISLDHLIKYLLIFRFENLLGAVFANILFPASLGARWALGSRKFNGSLTWMFCKS